MISEECILFQLANVVKYICVNSECDTCRICHMCNSTFDGVISFYDTHKIIEILESGE